MTNLLESKTYSYTPDNSCSPANPARGFYVQIRSDRPDKLERLADDKVTLCLLAYDLFDYRDQPLPEEKLRELELFLQQAREQKVQCIFRAAYGFHDQGGNDAASWQVLSGHVRQIAPILNAYKSQIYCVQAGFFGPWGEWHHSRFLEDPTQEAEARRALLDLLLTQLDGEIAVDVRRPRFIREYGESSRLGYHDDGLLSTGSDYGTYDDPDYSREEELDWLEQHIAVPHNGGEMPLISEYTDPQNAEWEFARMKVSYLNCRYNEQVLQDWSGKQLHGENALTALGNRLGYRYYISRIRMPGKLKKWPFGLGQKVTVTVSNQGFAPIDSRYHWELICTDGEGSRVLARFQPEKQKPGNLTFSIGGRLLRRAGDCRLGLRLINDADPERPDTVCLVNCGEMDPEGIRYFLKVRRGRLQNLMAQ